MNAIIASAVVTFAAQADDDHLSAALDDRPDGLNAGRTTFWPGESPAFLVWSSLGQGLGTLEIEAVGGSLQVVSAHPNAVKEKEQDVLEYLQKNQLSYEISLSPPAFGLPTFVSDYGPAVTVEAVKTYRDGTIGGVLLKRAAGAAGQWVIGKLKWESRARSYKIQTDSEDLDLERAILLATGTPPAS